MAGVSKSRLARIFLGCDLVRTGGEGGGCCGNSVLFIIKFDLKVIKLYMHSNFLINSYRNRVSIFK